MGKLSLQDETGFYFANRPPVLCDWLNLDGRQAETNAVTTTYPQLSQLFR